MKKSMAILEIFFIVIMLTSTVLAYENAATTVNSSVTTGQVNISLQEYEKRDNQEVIYSENNIVLPGDNISLIPRITNHGIDCYIRAKIDYFLEDGTKINTTDNISISNNWTKKNDYYYYEKVLGKGEKTDIFDTISIPTDISHNDQKISLNITVEAVQQKNFTVDFAKDEPWGYITIKECVDDNYDVSKVQSSANVTIKYDSDAASMVKVQETFFGDLTDLIPGSSIEEIVEIKNSKRAYTEYYFTTSIEDSMVDILKNYKLKILDSKNNILYDDTLYCEKKCSIGSYKPGHSEKLKFMISLDQDLDNSSSLNNGNLMWVFSTESDSSSIINPDTGDLFALYVIIFIISFILLIITIILNKYGGKHE